MKTLKESLLDIEGTIKRGEEATIEEGIRVFIKKLIKLGFPSSQKEMSDEDFNITHNSAGYDVNFPNGHRHTIVLDEGYIIPKELNKISVDGWALYCACNGSRADCSILNKIDMPKNTFELIAMQDEVTWTNFDTKQIKYTDMSIQSVRFESGRWFSECVTHKFENCNFGGIAMVIYVDADLRDTEEPVPGYTPKTIALANLNNCLIGKKTAFGLVKSAIAATGYHISFTKDGIIIPEYGDEIKLYNRYFPTDVVKGIKAKRIWGVNIDNLQLVDPSAEVVAVNTVDTINIKKSPLSFVPRAFLLGSPIEESSKYSSNPHFYKIDALDIDCEKFIDEFQQPDLKKFSSKSCKYINAINDKRLSATISKIIGSQPSSYKDIDDIINIKKLPNLKYISFTRNGRVEMLGKMPNKPFWTLMDKNDVVSVRRDYLETYG